MPLAVPIGTRSHPGGACADDASLDWHIELPVAPGDPGIAIDESALFAGRHHGNMQDSREYLAWEEELPGQIDDPILQQWHRLLAS